MVKNKKKQKKYYWFWLILLIAVLIFNLCGGNIITSRNRELNNVITNEIITVEAENVIDENIITEEPIVIEEKLYTNTDVNIRSGPGIEFEIIKSVPVNTEIIKIGEESDWVKIKWVDNEFYYIKNIYLSVEKTEVKKKVTTTSRSASSEIRVSVSNDYQSYAHDLVINSYNWTEYDFDCLVKLWTKESNWNPNSHNSSSGAHGIPQALPALKMASEGADYYTNGYTQIRWGLKYIAGRYSSPSQAWSFFCSHNWY